ncbi:MAG: hypothetical protein RLZZ298_3328 [Pseudomonadota bacterium]|jgi:hypothetical protein
MHRQLNFSPRTTNNPAPQRCRNTGCSATDLQSCSRQQVNGKPTTANHATRA